MIGKCGHCPQEGLSTIQVWLTTKATTIKEAVTITLVGPPLTFHRLLTISGKPKEGYSDIKYTLKCPVRIISTTHTL